MSKARKPINPKTVSRVMRAMRANAKPENMARKVTSEQARHASNARWAKSKEPKE